MHNPFLPKRRRALCSVFSPPEILDICVDFLQKAHGLDLPYSVRDGISALRYTLKMNQADPGKDTVTLFHNAIRQILGEEALDMESLAAKRKVSGSQIPSMNLGDFFFPDESDLNPDSSGDYQE